MAFAEKPMTRENQSQVGEEWYVGTDGLGMMGVSLDTHLQPVFWGKRGVVVIVDGGDGGVGATAVLLRGQPRRLVF
jgi:hypothetical protein